MYICSNESAPTDSQEMLKVVLGESRPRKMKEQKPLLVEDVFARNSHFDGEDTGEVKETEKNKPRTTNRESALVW